MQACAKESAGARYSPPRRLGVRSSISFGWQTNKKDSTAFAVLSFCPLVTRSRIELLLPPWKGGVLAAWPTGLVAGIGLEPMTYRVWTGCSSQLSYPARFTNARILYHKLVCLSILFWKIFAFFQLFFWFARVYDNYLQKSTNQIKISAM